MSEEKVTITLREPLPVREAGKSYFIQAGETEIQLPAKLTTLEKNDDGLVTAFTIPKWLHEKKESMPPLPVLPLEDRMRRRDWFLLGTTVALLLRDSEKTYHQAVWDANILVSEMLREEDE